MEGDKILHLFVSCTLFNILSLTCFRDVNLTSIIVLLIGICYEILQYITNTGTCDLNDVIADLIGIGIGIIIFKSLNKEN